MYILISPNPNSENNLKISLYFFNIIILIILVEGADFMQYITGNTRISSISNLEILEFQEIQTFPNWYF